MTLPTMNYTVSLYLGRDIQGTSQVSWSDLMDCLNSLDLPSCYTITEGYGTWANNQGTMTVESTYILSIVCSSYDVSDVEYGVERIGLRYKQWFKQEAVLMTTTPCSSRLL